MPDPQYAPDDWLRVRDNELGYDSSIRGSQFLPGAYEVLDQDALDHAGNPLPPDYHLDNRKNKAESAATKKEKDNG